MESGEIKKATEKIEFDKRYFWIPIIISIISVGITAISQCHSAQRVIQIKKEQEQTTKDIEQLKSNYDTLYNRMNRLEGSITDTILKKK